MSLCVADAALVFASLILGFVAALTASASAPAPSGTFVLYEPEILAHREIVEALKAYPFKLAPLGRPWGHMSAPRQVIAVGDRAHALSAEAWPDVRTAVALSWRIATPAPSLTITARPKTACTVAVLKAEASGEHWLVLASPHDHNAVLFAQALGAHIMQGDVRQLQHALRDSSRSHFWLRADPELAVPTWLRFLAQMSQTYSYVASDAPGLEHHGLAVPVRIDTAAVARRLVRWTHRRRARQRSLTLEEDAPCRAP